MYTYVNGITVIVCSRSQLLHGDIHTVIKNTQVAVELKISSSTTITLCDLLRSNTSMFSIQGVPKNATSYISLDFRENRKPVCIIYTLLESYISQLSTMKKSQ